MITATCVCGTKFQNLVDIDGSEVEMFNRFLDRHKGCQDVYSECCGVQMNEWHQLQQLCPRCKERCVGEVL